MNNPSVLSGYLRFLQEKLGLRIAVKDRVGFYPALDPEFAVALLGYLFHDNPYCEYVKADRKNRSVCIEMFSRIDRRCKSERKTFYGTCHGGVGEFITPIFTDSGEYLGFLTAGSFRMPRGERRVRRLCREATADKEALLCYGQLPNCPPDIEDVSGALELAAEYIAGSYQERVRGRKTHLPLERPPEDDYLLSRILHFLELNRRDNITVSDIADALHCSESAISHVFRKGTGLTVRSYINRLRVTEAKRLLRTTHDSISAIADGLGFCSADYFARVFARFTGCSPTEYRSDR